MKLNTRSPNNAFGIYPKELKILFSQIYTQCLLLLFSHQVMSSSCDPLWTIASQAPLSMGFSRQVHWSGLPFPPPGNLPDPGSEPTSPALAGGFFTTEPPGKPTYSIYNSFIHNCQNLEATKISSDK